MPYKLTAQPMPGYLHIKVTGENTIQNVRDYITEVGALCKEQEYSTVLVEENLHAPGLNMFDIVKVIKGLRSTPQELRWIVYVDANPAHDPTMMDFAKDLAVRRGLHVHICRSVQDAIGWIELLTQ